MCCCCVLQVLTPLPTASFWHPLPWVPYGQRPPSMKDGARNEWHYSYVHWAVHQRRSDWFVLLSTAAPSSRLPHQRRPSSSVHHHSHKVYTYILGWARHVIHVLLWKSESLGNNRQKQRWLRGWVMFSIPLLTLQIISETRQDRCFTAAGLKLWNSLPPKLRQAYISY